MALFHSAHDLTLVRGDAVVPHVLCAAVKPGCSDVGKKQNGYIDVVIIPFKVQNNDGLDFPALLPMCSMPQAVWAVAPGRSNAVKIAVRF